MYNFINIAGEILILKCYSCLQPSFAQHLKSLEFEKLNLRKKHSKLPTSLLLLTYRGGVI